MKKLIVTIGISIFLLFAQDVLAQSAFFEEVDLEKTDLEDGLWDQYEKMKNNETFSKVSRVKINNLKTLQEKGKMSFRLPGHDQILTAYPTFVDAVDKQNYEWVGELVNEEGETVGAMTLLSEKGAMYGTFQAFGEEYLLQDLGAASNKERITVLAQYDSGKQAGNSCGAHGGPAEADGDWVENLKSEARMNCNADIRVLVLYTNKAYFSGINPSQKANAGISYLNTAIHRSGDPNNSQLKFTLAGVQRVYNFEGSGQFNYQSDLGSSTVNDYLRSTYRADLVITFTNENYLKVGNPSFQIQGYAYINDYTSSSTDKFGLVEIDANARTFAHEIGHLMGGRHEDDPSSYSNRAYNWSGCPQNFAGGAHQTIMYHNVSSSSALQNFSNPNITHIQCPTGTSNNNVFARMMANRCAVYNFNSDNSNFRAFINGPSYIYNSSQYFTWSAQTVGCSNITSYNWAYSTNGYSYTTFSSSSTASKRGNTFPVGFRTIFIRLRVTCSNGEVATKVITVTNYSYYWYHTDKQAEVNEQGDLFADSPFKVSISPNPVRHTALLGIESLQASTLTIQLVNELGQSVRNLREAVSGGYHEIQLNLEDVQSGMYFIRVASEGEAKVYPIVVQK